jgi:hypothetical protein
MKADTGGFSEFAKSGFQIRFENGWTVSVQFTATHYCANRKMDDGIEKIFNEVVSFGQELSSPNAEVAAFKGGEWHEFEDGDNVKGYVTPAELLVFMNEIASKP